MHPGDVSWLSEAGHGPAESTRQWLVAAHRRLEDLLPAGGGKALLTEDLVDASGRAIDVFDHFRVDPKRLTSLRHNWEGLAHTAQASGAVTSAATPTPPWPGYTDEWIPVADNVQVSARIGWTEVRGERREADCIVILPGLLGDNNVRRTRDLADAIRAGGFHVLCFEFRGHGRTLRERPNLFYNFGTLETVDLLAVSRWLEDQPHVRRTGLIGFCWGANHALLAGWFDGRPERHPSLRGELAAHLPGVAKRAHYTAGIMAFSPVLSFETLIEQLERSWSRFKNPVLCGLQASIEARMKHRGFDDPCGSLRRLIEEEYARSPLSYRDAIRDGLRFLRWLPHRGEPSGDKLVDIRVPTVIVQGANDPLAPAQDVADVLKGIENRKVAAVILPGGGHIGFAAYAKRYYFSLIMNFFRAERSAVDGVTDGQAQAAAPAASTR